MDAERTIKAMGDATRRRILQLVARQELAVSEIVDCLGQPQSTVSRHLKVLRDAGLIQDRRDGTTALYTASRVDGDENGDPARLAGHILEWVNDQDLPKPLSDRLASVLKRRQSRSTDFFSQVGHRWDRMRLESFGDSFHRDALITLLPADWVVADIGTGTGYMLPMLSETFRKVIAVDPVPEMLEAARSRCRTQRIKNVAFRRGDMSRLPISNRQADLVLAVLVLHHVPSPEEALGELFRIAKPGGHLLVVEQRSHRLESFHERMQDRWWGFEAARLAKTVAEAGFQDVRHQPLRSEPVKPGAVEAPELFTLTARRPDAMKTTNEQNESRTGSR